MSKTKARLLRLLNRIQAMERVPACFGCSRDELIAKLDAADIEARSVWKPMHLQPLYAGAERYGGEVAEDLFRRSICLPSSSSLTVAEQLYVVNQVRRLAGAPGLTELCETLTPAR